MALLPNLFRENLQKVKFLNEQLDTMAASFEVLWKREHNTDGTHKKGTIDGTIHVDTAFGVLPGGGGYQTLRQFIVPPNTLSHNGSALRITAYGTAGTTAPGDALFRVDMANVASSVMTSAAVTGTTWRIDGLFSRRQQSLEALYLTYSDVAGATTVPLTAPTIDLAGAVSIDIKANNVAASSISLSFFSVEVIAPPLALS